MRRVFSTFLTVGVMVGVWLLLFQAVGLVDLNQHDQPISIQSTLSDTSTARSGYEHLVEQVVPLAGQTIPVVWVDMGQKLIDAGAIDLVKFETQYGGLTDEQRDILLGESLQEIVLTGDNIQFWTNVLWSLGLTQQSQVLDEGLMKQREDEVPIGNYASTGGWILGSKNATELYGSAWLIKLTPEQNEMVYHVAEHIFRPCCGNHTAYPDCNHGMAVLGLLELLAAQGASEDELYEAALTFNSYAFPTTYITLAAYMEQRGIPWLEVNPKTVLGSEYSSASGAKQTAAQVGTIPDAPGSSGGCSA